MAELHEIIVSRLIEDLPAGLLVIDPDGVIVTVSPATSSLLGIPLSSIKGRGWGEIFFGREENDQFNQLFLDVIQNETASLRREVCYTTALGNTLRLNVRCSFIRNEGSLVAIMVLLNDVTDIYRVQEAERRIIIERSHQQDEKIESLNRLAQSIAHQVRNPASTIGGFAKRIESILASHGVNSSYPSIILEQATRLENIVHGVVRLGKLHARCITRLDASKIIDMALAQAGERAKSVGKRLVPSLSVTKPILKGDESLLTQALSEILNNCVDFSDTVDVVLEIQVEPADGGARIIVTDQGPGISQDALTFVFDPFFTSKSLGSGLGLTVARQAVLEHGGTIKAGPGPFGSGTTVEILLPGTVGGAQSSNPGGRDDAKNR